MPLSDGVIATYHSRLHTYRTLLSAGLVAAWDDLDNYSDDDLQVFMQRVTPFINGAKTVTVATSAAFFALALDIAPVGVPAAAVPVEARATHPFLSTWHALKEGRSIEDAVAAGRSQAEAVGFDYVQSTARRTGDHVAAASGQRVRWRRVPGAVACDWCRTVSGQLYKTSESADFGHDRCDCVAVPA